MSGTETLSSSEVEIYHWIAGELVAAEISRPRSRRFGRNGEIRARYVAEEDGDFESYYAAAFRTFEFEWNEHLDGTAEADAE